ADPARLGCHPAAGNRRFAAARLNGETSMQGVDTMFEPLRIWIAQFSAWLPRLLLALLVLLAGWLIAKAVRFAVVKALRAVNFHVVTERAGLDGFLVQGGAPEGAVG